MLYFLKDKSLWNIYNCLWSYFLGCPFEKFLQSLSAKNEPNWLKSQLKPKTTETQSETIVCWDKNYLEDSGSTEINDIFKILLIHSMFEITTNCQPQTTTHCSSQDNYCCTTCLGKWMKANMAYTSKAELCNYCFRRCHTQKRQQ